MAHRQFAECAGMVQEVILKKREAGSHAAGMDRQEGALQAEG